MNYKLIFLFLLLMPGLFYAQPVEFTVQEAVNYARENGYSVRNKKMDYEKAKKVIKETRAMGLPQVSASAEMNYNQEIPQQPVPAAFLPDPPPGQDFVLLAFGVAHQSSYGLSARQLIFDGSYIVALMASRVYKEIANLELEESKIDVTEQVYNAYGNVVVSRELVKILEENLISSKKTLLENEKLFEEGFLEQQDVDQIELLVSNLENNIAQAKQQSKLALMGLKLVMGVPQEKEIELSNDLSYFTELSNMSSEILETRFNLDRDIGYRTALTQERAALLTMRNEQMSLLPKVNGFFNYSQNTFGNSFGMFDFDRDNWVPFSVLGVSLQWDVFTGFRRSARIQQTRIDLDRAVMNKQFTSEQAQIDYETAKGNLSVAVKSVQTSKRNRDLAKKILDNTRVKYREGLAGSLDLTQAENQFLENERNYINALLQLVSARSALEKMIGNFNTY